jgi:hypothetical protein
VSDAGGERARQRRDYALGRSFPTRRGGGRIEHGYSCREGIAMANETHDVRSDTPPVFLAWGMPAEAPDAVFDGPALWLTGGISLLVWTALALLLTAT